MSEEFDESEEDYRTFKDELFANEDIEYEEDTETDDEQSYEEDPSEMWIDE